MHNFLRTLVLTATVVATAAPAAAATPSEFYTSLLRRGIAAYDAGRYEDASRQLRIAAFGLIDAVEFYETAQTYLALTYNRLGDAERTREAVRRLVIADRNQRRFATLNLPAPVRSAFLALAANIASPAELATLRAATGTPQAQPAPPTAVVDEVVVEEVTRPATATPEPQTPAQPATASAQTQPQTTPPTPNQQPATTNPQPHPAAATPEAQPQSTPTAPDRPSTSNHQPTPPNHPPATSNQQPPRPASTLTPSEIANRLLSAGRALTAADLVEARRLYREILNAGAERATLLRVAEGLYRARDFAGALAAFERIGTLQDAEQPYRYYIAVALYETGQYARARAELAAVLPHIEITPDVARYRARIEGAAN